MSARVFATLLGFILLFATTQAHAGAAERRAKHEAEIVAPLEAKNPEAARWFKDAAMGNERDTARALDLYERVNQAEPTFTPAIRRRAMLLAGMGRREESVALARKAVALENTRDNRGALAYTLALPLPDKPPPPDAAKEAIEIARKEASEQPNDIDEQLGYCQVALATMNLNDLQTCSSRCVQLAPNEPEPYYFATFAAIARGDRDAARAAIANGRARGMEEAMAAHLEEVMELTEAPIWRWGKRLLIIVAVWLAGLALLWGVGGFLSRRTLELSEHMAQSREEHPGSATMRSWYRVLLHVASAYYYASLPLVLLLSILAGGSAILAFLYVGHIPLYLFALALMVIVYTIKSVIKSLVIRARDEDPGLAVDLGKHRGLARVLREVADRVDTKPVDEVYLTTNAEVAVFERGGFMRQVRGTTERCLLLGVGVLDGMTQQQFKAILAHEYGHFTNRDTAGGGIALGVRRSLLHTALGLVQGGAAAWYNPAWLFVIAFQKIFLRISQGASRLQEVMADRVAANAYGHESFASGLAHVIRRGVEVDAHISATLKEVLEAKLPLPNLYRYELKEGAPVEDIEEEVKKALDREPSPYDSHPKPADRMRWLRKLSSSLAPAPTDAEDAWSLFQDRETVQARMTAEIRERLAEQGVVIPEEAGAAA